MSRTVTMTFEEEVCQRLEKEFGGQPFAQVIENLLRPYIMTEAEIAAGYAAMAADKDHEAEALEWIESAPDDGFDDWDDDWTGFPPP